MRSPQAVTRTLQGEAMSKEEDRDPLIRTEITTVPEKKMALLGERPLIREKAPMSTIACATRSQR
jgi:hypothetical protein